MALDDETGAPAVLVERSLAWGISFAALVVGSFVLMGVYRTDPQQLIAWPPLAITAAAVAAAGWVTYQGARRTAALVSVSSEGVALTTPRGRKLLARGAIRKGKVFVGTAGQRIVVLRDRRGLTTRLEVKGDEEARAILAAVGVDRREGTTRFVVKRRSPGSTAIGIVASVSLVFSLVFLSGVPLALLLVWIAAPLAWLLTWMSNRITMTVGADGVELNPLLGRRRFLPHSKIARVTEMLPPQGQLVSHGFVMARADSNELIEIDTRDERFRGGIWNSDPIRDAVQRAWTAAHGASAAKAGIQQLANEGGSTREWIAKLRALGSGEQRADYRAPAIDERALFDVVGDATADAEVRAAAAVALGASAEHAPRLRVVADDIADDRIRRVALAAVEPEADERLEEELEPLRARMRTR